MVPKRSAWFCAWCFSLVALVGFSCLSVDAQEPTPPAEPSPPAEPTPPADAGAGSLTAAEREKLLAEFHATSATFEDDGRVCLVYDFEQRDLGIVEDFVPDMADTKRRVRWSQGYEGTFRTVENGIVIADHGTWMHEALWKSATLEVEYMSMAPYRRGDLLAAVFSYDKGRRTVGSNNGTQCVRLKGDQHAGKPHPAEPEMIESEKRFRFGMAVGDGTVTSLRNGRPTCDTKEFKNFVAKPTSGMVGLVWRGTINGFIFKVTIVGDLDPEWVDKKLGRTPAKAPKSAARK
ncbi:MAG: hypothetical protein AB7O52_16255 [Planctomycetota bacterium]